MASRAEKKSANSRVFGGSLRGADGFVSSKRFLIWHFGELWFCQVFSSWWLDSARVKKFIRPMEFVLSFECGAKKSMQLEGKIREIFFVLALLI